MFKITALSASLYIVAHPWIFIL